MPTEAPCQAATLCSCNGKIMYILLAKHIALKGTKSFEAQAHIKIIFTFLDVKRVDQSDK